DFRGLLGLYSCYGPLNCSTAHGGLCHEASAHDGCPSKPLVSYRSNRQLSGWLLPPLATHAYRAHIIRSPRRARRLRNDSGIVRPKAFAVLRFTANSNLVGS